MFIQKNKAVSFIKSFFSGGGGGGGGVGGGGETDCFLKLYFKTLDKIYD